MATGHRTSTKPVPAPLSRTGICLHDWKNFRNDFEEYIYYEKMLNNGDYEDYYYKPTSEIRKVAELLRVIGKEWQEVYHTFDVTKIGTLTKVLDNFERYCEKMAVSNTVPEAFKFHTRQQQPGEKFDDFYADITQQADLCAFGKIKNHILRDKIVVGVADKILQEYLLTTIGLPLNSVALFCRFAENYKIELDKEVELWKKAHAVS